MSSQNIVITTSSAEETEAIAEQIGSRLRGGECIELTSDLGGGKTTFVRGLVRGAGSFDNVSSPTFTIGKQYQGETLRIYHFDFYRLQEPGLVAEELAESIEDENSVSVIEWARSVSNVLPASRIVIEIERLKDDVDARKLTIMYPKKVAYLIKDLK